MWTNVGFMVVWLLFVSKSVDEGLIRRESCFSALSLSLEAAHSILEGAFGEFCMAQTMKSITKETHSKNVHLQHPNEPFNRKTQKQKKLINLKHNELVHKGINYELAS